MHLDFFDGLIRCKQRLVGAVLQFSLDAQFFLEALRFHFFFGLAPFDSANGHTMIIDHFLVEVRVFGGHAVTVMHDAVLIGPFIVFIVALGSACRKSNRKETDSQELNAHSPNMPRFT